jgi:hypothetical protein
LSSSINNRDRAAEFKRNDQQPGAPRPALTLSGFDAARRGL